MPETKRNSIPTTMGEEEKNFWSHLEELRWCLFRVVVVLLVGVIGGFIAMPYLFEEFIMAPTTSEFVLYRWLAATGLFPAMAADSFSVEIINIKLASQFTTHISASFWLSLLVTFPYLVYELWRFISPALYQHERRSVSVAFCCGTLMFFLGCAVGYLLVFPLTFRFLAEYQLSADIANQISLNSYMSNFLGMIFVMGLVFELPLMTWLLSSLGVVNRATLCGFRRYAVVGLMVLSAFITPSGDPFTLAVVFVPLYLLYEVGVLVAKA